MKPNSKPIFSSSIQSTILNIASVKKENAQMITTSMRMRYDVKKQLDIYAAMNNNRGFGNVIAHVLEQFIHPATGGIDYEMLKNFLH